MLLIYNFIIFHAFDLLINDFIHNNSKNIIQKNKIIYYDYLVILERKKYLRDVIR